MVNKGKWRFCIFISIIFISFTFLFTQTNPTTALTASDTLFFGDYHYFYWSSQQGPPKYIEWSFSGSNSVVGIEVWLLNDEKFDDFQSFSSFSGYQLSDGGYYQASGEYDLPYSDSWYVVFWHNDDNIFASTSVTMTVNLETPTLPPTYNPDFFLEGWALGLIIGGSILFVIIITTIIAVSIRRKRKLRAIQSQPPTVIVQTVQPQSPPSPPVTPPPPVDNLQKPVSSGKIIYCMTCGSPSPDGKSYCGECGETLQKE